MGWEPKSSATCRRDMSSTIGPEVRPDPQPTTCDFEAFYRERWASTVRLAALLTQSNTAAEDLAQEAFTRVYRQWSRVRDPGPYLRSAVLNASRNYHARRRTERLKLPLLVDRETSGLDFAELADVVAALPYRQRAVLVLRYQDGLSEREIADALGCRPGTVKSLAARALARLKKVVEP